MRRGSNSLGVRRYNERLVLSTVRRMNGASKADLSKITGLSPQAAVRIVENLEAEGRLVRAGRRMGGMGQPSTIYQINGGSGCTVGVEIGRDRLTCVLLDFDGQVMACQSTPSEFPSPYDVIGAVKSFTSEQLAALPESQREGFLGFGIAMPWFIGEWREEAGISEQKAREWSSPDLEDRFRHGLDGLATFENDGNAGALAELLCGEGLGLSNFLYIHLGNFIGGGLVLNGEIKRGRNGNAGALASMPIPGNGSTDFLLHHASLYSLHGGPDALTIQTARWLDACADAIAFTIIGANSLLDLDAVIIGGALSDQAIDTLLSKIAAKMADSAPRDFFLPTLIRGRNGEKAPAIGAALLPLYSTYSPNLASLLKTATEVTTTERADA